MVASILEESQLVSSRNPQRQITGEKKCSHVQFTQNISCEQEFII